jgi:hypothetical protein
MPQISEKMRQALLAQRLLRDRSDFSPRAIKAEWRQSELIEFDATLLDAKDTVFFNKIDHPSRTRSLQINTIPNYPPLECEREDCDDLATLVAFVVPGPKYSVPTYIGFPKEDLEHKLIGRITFICNSHIDDFISIFLNYRDLH